MTPLLARSLSTWSNSCQSCSKCDISSLCSHKVTHRYYSNNPNRPNTDILFIGEAPGESEYSTATPFIGPSGEQLNKILLTALTPSTNYVITNSILCTPFSSESRSHIRTPSLSEVKACSTHLVSLVKRIRPKGYIALGAVAERSIKHLLSHYELPFVKIAHPSKIMQSLKYHYEFDKAVLTIRNFESQILR